MSLFEQEGKREDKNQPDFINKLIKQDQEVLLFFRKEMDVLAEIISERSLSKLKLYGEKEELGLRKRELKVSLV